MNPVRLDLTIVIEAGSLRHRVSLPELSLALGGVPLHELRTSLLGLFRDAFPLAPALVTLGEPLEGVCSLQTAGQSEKENMTLCSNRQTDARAREWTLPADIDSCAHVLALELGDTTSMKPLRRLVERHPRHVLEAALARTLALPQSHIERSRAAYFTALVRSLDARSPSSPYDSSTSSTTA